MEGGGLREWPGHKGSGFSHQLFLHFFHHPGLFVQAQEPLFHFFSIDLFTVKPGSELHLLGGEASFSIRAIGRRLVPLQRKA